MTFPIEDIEDFTKCFSSAKEMRFERVSGDFPSSLIHSSRILSPRLVPDGPHLLALSHAPLVISLMTSFLERHPSFDSSSVPLSPSDALSTLSKIASDPSLSSRDARNPLSYSLVSPQELKDGQERLDEMLRGEKECMLVLPMCHEMNDWDPVSTPQQRERKLRRWK